MSDFFDIASRPVPGAFFVRSSPARSFSAEALDATLGGLRGSEFDSARESLIWTRRGERSTLKGALLDMIRRAQRKVFIASFRIGDDDLFAELFDAADRLRGSVYVVTLVDDKSLAKGLAEADDDAGADEQALQKQFSRLVERGLYVRGHDSCHAKFVVVDDEVALVSSANLESRAFTTTTEIGVLLRDKGEVARLGRLFARLWHDCTWEVAPSKAYSVAKRARTQPPFRGIPEPLERQCAIWTHHDEHRILDAARETIKKAERDLLLASFSLTGMSANRELLLAEVERFRNRTGGRVRLLVRARNHVPSQRQDAKEFAALGCVVMADEVNHAKCVIADGKEAVLFSANFDAQHGLTSGVEVGVRLVEPQLVQSATAFFEGLLHAAPMKLLVSPSHEALQMLAAGWIKHWPAGRTVRVEASDSDWNAFIRLEAGSPVLFERDEDGRLMLFAGQEAFCLQEEEWNRRARLEHTLGASIDSSAILEKWLLMTGPKATIRGICAATFVRD